MSSSNPETGMAPEEVLTRQALLAEIRAERQTFSRVQQACGVRAARRRHNPARRIGYDMGQHHAWTAGAGRGYGAGMVFRLSGRLRPARAGCLPTTSDRS